MANSPTGQRLTRKLGEWLSHCGVDAAQYHWLLQMSLEMDFRGKPVGTSTGVSAASNSTLRLTIWLNLVLASTMAACFVLLGAGTALFTTASLGFGMLMIAVTTLTEFPRLVIAPEDFSILGPRPVSWRTFLAVKLSNLAFFIVIVGSSMSVVPAFLGLGCRGARWYFPLLYLPVAMVGFVFMMGAIVALYRLVFRLGGYLKSMDVLLAVQVVLIFVLFSLYNLLPWLNASGQTLIRETSISGLWNSWARFFPAFWFAGVVEICLGHSSREAILASAIAMLGLVLIVPLVLQTVSLSYSSQLEAINASTGQGKTSTRKILAARPLRWVLERILEDSEERAFFHFIIIMLRHNRLLKLQIYPTIGIIAAMFVPGLFSHAVMVDPFLQSDFGRAATFSMTSFTFAIAGLAAVLPYSSEYQGGWVFQVAPITRPEVVLRALKKAFGLFLFLPVFVCNVAFFAWHWPFSHALKLSVFGLLIGLLIMQLLLIRFQGFPFSRKLEGVAAKKFLVTFVAMLALPLILSLVPSPFAGNQTRFAIILCFLFVSVLALGLMNNRIYARRFSNID